MDKLTQIVMDANDEEAIEQLNELTNDSYFLDALQAAGVDNWEGYEVAQDMVEALNS